MAIIAITYTFEIDESEIIKVQEEFEADREDALELISQDLSLCEADDCEITFED